MIQSYIAWLMRWRVFVVVAALLSVAFLSSGMCFLKLDSDYRIFFNKENKELQAYETIQATYSKNDNALIVLAPKEGNVFTAQTLAAVADVTERAWQVPYSTRVDSLSNYQHTEAQGDELTVSNLVADPAQLNAKAIAKIRDIALHEPLLVHRLVSPSGHVTAINITVELPGKDLTRENPEAVAKIREIERYIQQTYPDIAVYVSGVVVMNAAFPEAIQYDLQHLMPLAALVILALVFFMLRQLTGTFITFLIMVFAITCAMGLTGWLGIHLSPPTMSVPIIILTLAIADCVHVLSNWQQQIHQGKDKITAMQESLRINFSPVFLTSLTTLVGFLSMNFSDAPPFRTLGNIAVFGVFFAWLLSISFLPALLTLLPSRLKAQPTATQTNMLFWAEFNIAHQNRLLWGIGLLIAGLVVFIPKNELNDVFVKYFDEHIPFRQATDFIVDNLTGVYFIDFSVDSGQQQGISSPQFQQQLDNFTQWLRQQPEVIHVNAITDIMKRLNRNLHADQDAWYRLPQQRDLAAQYLLLYEMSLPYGLDLNNQIDIDKRATRLFVTLKTLSSTELIGFEQRSRQWIDRNFPHFQVLAGSPSLMFAHIGQKNIRSMLIGTVLAFLAISLILMWAFGSWRYGLVSLAPNAVPAAMAFGLWGLLNGQVGLSLSVVAAMTMGIVVDDTVHFISKYRRALNEHKASAVDAVRYAFKTVGTAIWITSAALVAGFMVISTSAFELNAGMGFLVSLVIAFALLADFFFLPPLLIKLDTWLHKK